ncbi:Mobile element protein [Candidatus Nitrosotalea sp. FS]|uniref:IS5 family transposase n=1 Tax=Candidatus Nitrosotalea sp. FS TaxID=2341021 RepID=UPI00140D8AA8|nr:IS5 family transposase [Candidatus Nitrosotalea sp. FS]NHH97805.1 Mobile element protein [Candidatus Nitrosotalea sp. FS]
MRGEDGRQRAILVVINPEQRVPKGHPLRRIKAVADAALAQLSPLFDEMYSTVGRPSIPPERLLKASLLMALYTVRSERLLCEQLDYNFLFRWFLDLEADEASFDHSTFSRNRARLLEHEVAGEFFRAVVEQARGLKLLSDEHFTVDGTLVEAWASLKSFKRKDASPSEPPDDPGNPTVNFHGERRSNATHQSTTDPEAQLAKKGAGKEAKLCYSANALMENRHALLVDFQVEPADGYAERRAAIAMVDERLPGRRRVTLGGDKGYDTSDFVADCRALAITPHVARNQARRGGSALDARTVRHPGYSVSQWIRKQVEEAFGWMKTIGGLRKTRYRGRERVQMHAYLVAAAYNLIRIAKLSPAPA